MEKKIIKIHTELCESTGDKIQKEKTQTFTWIWHMINGECKIVNKPNRLTVHRTRVKQLKVNECVRALGVTIGPSLD